LNRKLLCFDELIEQVVAVVVMVARGALFDQAACGISDQLGAQGAGSFRRRGARFRGISPEGRKFLKSGGGAGDAARFHRLGKREELI
jgi:hypothetical protein